MYNWWQIHLSLHKLFLVISIFFKRYLLFFLTRKKNFVIRLEFHKPKSKYFSIYFSIETQSVTYRRKDYRSYLAYLTQFTSYVTWNRFGRMISWKDLAMERVEENGSGKNDGGRANGECSIVWCNITPVAPCSSIFISPTTTFSHSRENFLPLLHFFSEIRNSGWI